MKIAHRILHIDPTTTHIYRKRVTLAVALAEVL